MENLFYDDLGIILYLFSIISSICFGFFFFINKEKTRPQFFLMITFFVYAFTLLVYFSFDRYVYLNHNEMFRLVDSMITVPGVICSYIYFTSLHEPQKLNSRFIVRQIMPYLIILVAIVVPVTIFYPRIPHLNSFSLLFSNINEPTVILRLLAMIYVFVYETYIVWNVVAMHRKYSRYIRDNYSFKSGIDLRWLPYIISAFWFLGIVDFVAIATNQTLFKIIFGFTSVFLLFSIFYLGSRQGELPVPDESPAIPSIPDYKMEMLKERMIKYFEEKKPYLNKELKVQDLAVALFTNRSYISIVFKELDSSFYSFVNSYRIQFAMELMIKKPGYTVDYYADASGFKSRSVFFNQFKESTGTTPNNYLSKQKINLLS